MEEFMQEEEEGPTRSREPIVNPQDVSEWAFLSMLEFLDGRIRVGGALHGLPFEKVAALSPSEKLLREKETQKLSRESLLVLEGKEDYMDRETLNQMKEMDKKEKEEEKKWIQELKKNFALDDPYEEVGLEGEEITIEARGRKIASLVLEDSDFRDQVFYHALNCGLEKVRIKKILSKLGRSVHAKENSSIRYGRFGVYAQDVAYPLNRLRISTVQGDSTDGFYLHEQVGNVRMHRGMKAGSILFLPVLASDELKHEEEDDGYFSTDYGNISLLKLREVLRRGESSRIPNLVPLVTLQVGVRLLGYLRGVTNSDFLNETEEKEIIRSLSLIIGGERVLSRARISDDQAKVVREATKQLVWLPVLTGRNLKVPDLSDLGTINAFRTMYQSLMKKSSEFTRLTAELRRSIGLDDEPYNRVTKAIRSFRIKEMNTETLFDLAMSNLLELANAPEEIASFLVTGLGYDGYFVHGKGVGSIFMIDYASMENAMAFDVHIRHLDFGLGNASVFTNLRTQGIYENMSAVVGVKKVYHTSSKKQEERLYLMANSNPQTLFSGMASARRLIGEDKLKKALCFLSVRIETSVLESMVHSSRQDVAHTDIFFKIDTPINFGEGLLFGRNPPAPKGEERRKTELRNTLSRRLKLRRILWNVAVARIGKERYESISDEYPFVVDVYPEYATLSKLDWSESVPPLSKRVPMAAFTEKGKLSNLFPNANIEIPAIYHFRLILAEFLNRTQMKQAKVGEEVSNAPLLVALDTRTVPVRKSVEETQEEAPSAQILRNVSAAKVAALDRWKSLAEAEMHMPKVQIATPLSFHRIVNAALPKTWIPKDAMPPRIDKRGLSPEALKRAQKQRKSKVVKACISWLYSRSTQIVRSPFPQVYAIAKEEGIEEYGNDFSFLRFAATHSATCAQASLVQTWIHFAERLDSIARMHKPFGLGQRGVGAWGPMAYFKPIFSDANGYIPFLDKRLEVYDTSIHSKRLVLKGYKDEESPRGNMRAFVIGDLYRLFEEYLETYQALLRTHWELQHEVSFSQLQDAYEYKCSALRMWHLDAVEQTLRLATAMITYFSFRRDALFGQYFTMATLSRSLVPTMQNRLVDSVTSVAMKAYIEWLYAAHSRQAFTWEERTPDERKLLLRTDDMSNWASTSEARRRFYGMGALEESTLPTWKGLVEDRVLSISTRRGVSPLDIELSEPPSDVDPRLYYPSWTEQAFGRVKFSTEFTLESFDPSVYSNANTFQLIRGLEGLSSSHVSVLLDWIARRKNETDGPGSGIHDPAVRIRHSGDPAKGNGLFCDDPRGIPPGTFIVPFDGYLALHSQIYGDSEDGGLDKRYYNPMDLVQYGIDRKTGEPIYVVPGSVNAHYFTEEKATGNDAVDSNGHVVKAHISRYCNGAVSKSFANCTVARWIVQGQQQLWIVNASTRTILRGEELTWSYSAEDNIDFYRDIGLYSRSPGFIYPPEVLYDYTGLARMQIETDDPMTTVYDPVFGVVNEPSIPLGNSSPSDVTERARLGILRDPRSSDVARDMPRSKFSVERKKKVIRLENELQMRRLLLFSVLYDGTLVDGKAAVPLLDYHIHRRSEIERFFLGGATPEPSGRVRTITEVQQSLPFLRKVAFEQFVFRTQPVYTMRDSDAFVYFGVPKPRLPQERIFVDPLFKRLAATYGNSAIIDLEPKLDLRNYDNMDEFYYFSTAEIQHGDNSISAALKRSDIQDNVVADKAMLEGITQHLFSARRAQHYEAINALLFESEELNVDEMNRLVTEAKDLSIVTQKRRERYLEFQKRLEEVQMGEGGVQTRKRSAGPSEGVSLPPLAQLVRYQRVRTLQYTDLAKKLLQKVWEMDGGYSMYSQSDMVAQHYQLVHCNAEDTSVYQRGSDRLSTRRTMVFVQDYGEKSVEEEEKTVVRYSGDMNKGLGLYAKKRILPGEPILPFLGEVMPEYEYEQRVLNYSDTFEGAYEWYQQLVHKKIQALVQSTEGATSEKDLDPEEVKRWKRDFGFILAESFGLDHPPPGYYSASYVEMDGIPMIIDPSLKGNDARFSNSSRFFNNCTLEFVLVKRRGDSEITHDVVPWLINTMDRSIEPGEEILWDYVQHEITPEGGLSVMDYDDAPWNVDPTSGRPLFHERVPIDVRPPTATDIVEDTAYFQPGYKEAVHIPTFPTQARKVVEHGSLSFSEIQERLGLILVKSESSFQFGKERIHGEWSQMSMVLPPVTAVSRSKEGSTTIPVRGNEILANMLSAQGFFFPVGMSPLSYKGDLIHQDTSGETEIHAYYAISMTRGLSNAITAGWCNAVSFFHALPMRHFDHTAVRNRWLDVAGGGLEEDRKYTLSNEFKTLLASSDTGFKFLGRAIAFATLAIDDLQKRLFTSLIGVASDEERMFDVQEFIRKEVLSSQARRNLLFMVMASWRTTSALFTSYRLSLRMQFVRIQALLRALGFTKLYFSVTSVVAGKEDPETLKRVRRFYAFPLTKELSAIPVNDMEETTSVMGQPFYEHEMDGLLADEKKMGDKFASRGMSLDELHRRTFVTLPIPPMTKVPEPMVRASTREERDSIIASRDVDRLEDVYAIIDEYDDIFSSEALSLLYEPTPRKFVYTQAMQAIRRSVRENLEVAQTRLYEGQGFAPSTRNDFQWARGIIEAYFDFMIYNALPYLEVIFQRMSDRVHTTLAGREAVRLLKMEIRSYPQFMEWKTRGKPSKYLWKSKLVVNGGCPDMPEMHSDAFDGIVSYGPAVYHLLAFYAMRLYLRHHYRYVLRDNERRLGPVLFRSMNTKQMHRVYPWWSASVYNAPSMADDKEMFEDAVREGNVRIDENLTTEEEDESDEAFVPEEEEGTDFDSEVEEDEGFPLEEEEGEG